MCVCSRSGLSRYDAFYRNMEIEWGKVLQRHRKRLRDYFRDEVLRLACVTPPPAGIIVTRTHSGAFHDTYE